MAAKALRPWICVSGEADIRTRDKTPDRPSEQPVFLTAALLQGILFALFAAFYGHVAFDNLAKLPAAIVSDDAAAAHLRPLERHDSASSTLATDYRSGQKARFTAPLDAIEPDLSTNWMLGGPNMSAPGHLPNVHIAFLASAFQPRAPPSVIG